LILLREFDERLGLSAGLRALFDDRRDARYVAYPALAVLRQRIYQIAGGYEDANDASFLRHDPPCARWWAGITVRWPRSQPCRGLRTRRRGSRPAAWAPGSPVGFAITLRAKTGKQPRRSCSISMSTSDPTHGQQQLSCFNGYYDTYMYHPPADLRERLGDAPCLRSAGGERGRHGSLLPLLRPLVTELRRRLPERPIALRPDGEFGKPALLDYAEYTGCCQRRTTKKENAS
jgi:Transposase DDE domain group 1